jgi:hypothetical protein
MFTLYALWGIPTLAARAADADLPSLEATREVRHRILANHHIGAHDPARIPHVRGPTPIPIAYDTYYTRLHVTADPAFVPERYDPRNDSGCRVSPQRGASEECEEVLLDLPWECVEPPITSEWFLPIPSEKNDVYVNFSRTYAVRAGGATLELSSSSFDIVEQPDRDIEDEPPRCLAWSDAPRRGCTTLTCGTEVVHACPSQVSRYTSDWVKTPSYFPHALVAFPSDADWRRAGGIVTGKEGGSDYGTTLTDLDGDQIYERIDWLTFALREWCGNATQYPNIGSNRPAVAQIYRWRDDRWVVVARGTYARFFRKAWAAALYAEVDSVPERMDDGSIMEAYDQSHTLLRLAESGVSVEAAAIWIAAAYPADAYYRALRCAHEHYAPREDPWTAVPLR